MKVPNIKFNLKFYDAKGGEIVVRTMDDLRAKANLSDLYDYFKDGVLSRWLRSIGDDSSAQKIDECALSDGIAEQVEFLSMTLGLGLGNDEMRKFSALVEEQIRLRQKKQGEIQLDGCSQESYLGFLRSFIEHSDDFVFVRKTLKEMMSRYPDKFKEDCNGFRCAASDGYAERLSRNVICEPLFQKCPFLFLAIIADPIWRMWLGFSQIGVNGDNSEIVYPNWGAAPLLRFKLSRFGCFLKWADCYPVDGVMIVRSDSGKYLVLND